MEAKWRRQFAHLGRERVRHLVEIGGITGPRQRREAAERWLRHQERGSEKRERWTLAIVIFAALVGFLALLAALN